MFYRQAKQKTLLFLSFLSKEFGSLIAKDLRHLKKNGYRFTCCVSDGGTGIKNAILRVYGNIPHQICMAHIHRQAINSIGRFPKDERVRKLKKIADHIWLIESKEALRWWTEKLQDWIKVNRDFLHETKHLENGGWWYIHKSVRKCVRILVSAPDNCFIFLDHPLVPKTTNELEAQLGIISIKHLIHRGLKRERIQSFLKWFVYFYNKKLLSQRKS